MAHATPSATPNPNAMKFSLDVTLPETINFQTAEAAAGHPFGEAAFQVPGVKAVFGVNDFVTITRAPDGDWDMITPAIVEAAATHL